MRTLGVIGGMGPLATVDFLRKLVVHTDAVRDSEHIPTLTYSSCTIPDRSAYISGEGESPLGGIVASAKKLWEMGADILVMPCNTAHYFYEEITEEVPVPLINMIEETARVLRGHDRVALLATEGTYESGIYAKYLKREGIEVIYPAPEVREEVTEIIYSIKGGTSSGERKILEGIRRTADHLRDLGAERIILGCTELSAVPLAPEEEAFFVDPSLILAKAAICRMGKCIKSFS